MSKKRVHEIAKELKEKHGIEFDNKQVVTELVGLGYDVKSHSSSLEDDQAEAAIQKILDKRKPKAAPAPASARGFVVRRRVGDNVVAAQMSAPAAQTKAEAGDVAVAGSPPDAVPAANMPAASETLPATREVESAPVSDAAPRPSSPPASGAHASGVPAVAVSAVSAPAPGGSASGAPAGNPGLATSGLSAPAGASGGVSASSVSASGVSASSVSAQSASAQAVSAHGVSAPGVSAPGVSVPGVPAHGVSASGASAPAEVSAAASVERGPEAVASLSMPPTVSSGSPGGSGAFATSPASAAPASAAGVTPAASTGSSGSVSGVGSAGVRAGPRASAPTIRTAASMGGRAPAPGVRPPVNVTTRPGQAPGRLPLGIAAVQNRPPSPAGATATGPVAPVRTVPTATQAVLVSRPLIPIKRVTPSQPGASRYPMAPGRKAIGTTGGAVREFKVVPGPTTGQREGFGVRKDDARRPGSGQRREKEKEQTTTSDIKEFTFGRSAIPVRGKKKKPTKKGQKTQITEMAEEKKVIKVQEGITVSDLSQRMGVKTTELIRKLMQAGKMATATQTIDVDTAGVIATDYGWSVKKVGFEVEDFLPKVDEKAENLISRPPVVTVMGHVDHGKTSLLDAIRAANVASGEAGGITQHVGAYTVKSSQGDITFLDTPGHAAFSAMRARGANITDVVVLVVAGDDGVMPQTKEAIQHAQKAEVPIVVAINKMDLAAANPDRVKKELADIGLLAEDWGGETIMAPVSAKTKQGLDLLLENISLQAEVLELKANPSRPANAIILEARLEKGRGPIATVLVQEGTLKKGDAIVSGTHYGRVRMMLSDRGELVEEVKPGYSAEVIGLSGVPTAGDVVNAVADEKAAKQIADHRILKARQAEAGKTARESLDDLLNKQKVAEQKELKIVLKADVSGSLEAVADALAKLSTKKVKVTIVQKGVGMMTETDIGTAEAFAAVVVGFNSKPESGAEAAAKQKEVKWETFSIIYELLDGVTKMMEDLLDPIRTEKKIGRAEVRNLFNVPKLGTIAGSSVTEGTIKRSAIARLVRANKQVFQGKIASLKRFKDDVREVGQGYECGIGLEGATDIQVGDVIEAYEVEETRPSLN